MTGGETSPDDPAPRVRPGRARTLSCPQCGSPVTIRASGLSVTAVCASCGAVLDVANNAVRQIAEAQARTQQPAIAIGTRGTLAGTVWEVVGYQRRSSEAGSWQWDEYLLFNPYRGFRFLAQDHGHWTLYGMLRRDVADPARDGGDGLAYRPTETVRAQTDYVLGEFYWRVRVGDAVGVREFVHPPFVLSEERAAEEVTWSRGRYMEPAIVQAALGLARMPPRDGRAAHQPRPKRRRLWPWTVGSLAALVLLHTCSIGQGLDTLVLEQSFTVGAADQDRVLPAIPLTIPDAGGNLQIAASAALDGSMLQLDVSLVPQAGLRRQETMFALGSPVADGTIAQTAVFASVAGGAASLLIRPHSTAFAETAMTDGTAGTVPAPAVSFLITVRRHVRDDVGLLFAVVAIIGWPIVATLWRWLRRIGGRPA